MLNDRFSTILYLSLYTGYSCHHGMFTVAWLCLEAGWPTSGFTALIITKNIMFCLSPANHLLASSLKFNVLTGIDVLI